MAEPSLQSVESALAGMGLHGRAAAVLMIVFGVLILVFPYLVAVLVGIGLIVVGLLQLMASAPPAGTPDRPAQGGQGASAGPPTGP